jgi:hypothetical protein
MNSDSSNWVLNMSQRGNLKVDPSQVFVQADCFYKTLAVLCNADPNNIRLAVIIGEPVMVIAALTIELFLKCLVCMETGDVPFGHRLKELFERLSVQTQSRIEKEWDRSVAAHRAREWDDLEKRMGVTIARDLPSALAAGSDAFERIRYSYEGNTENVQFYLQDLPQLLGRTIVAIKPEWKTLTRTYQELPRS